MNRARRKEIKIVINNLNQAKNYLETALEQLQAVTYDEQEAFDNMPESLQESERGCTMQDNIDALEEQLSVLEDEIDIESIISSLEVLIE